MKKWTLLVFIISCCFAWRLA